MEINLNDLNKNSLIMQWNRDANGNPTSIKIENEVQQISVTHNLIQLAQIPDQYYKVKIGTEKQWLTEVFNKRELTPETFLVDYHTGLVYFHKDLSGKPIIAEYYGRGVILLSDARIFHKTGENFFTTLDEVLEGGKDALALLESTGGLAQAIELLDEKAEEGNIVADRIEGFIEDTRFYGYTIVLSREAFVVKSDEDGYVEIEEINSVYSDVVVYKGAVQITPQVSIVSQVNCEFKVEGQQISLVSFDMNSVKCQVTIEIDCGDGLKARRIIEVTKVFDGVTPYQVEIDNTFFSFNAEADGKLKESQSVVCNFKVTKANEEYRGYKVIIQNMPNGLLNNLPSDTTNLQSVTFTATTGATLPDNGTVIIQFQLDSETVINKSFVYSKAKQGITAQFLSLVGNQILRYSSPDYSDIPTPSRPVISAIVSGLSGTPIWSVKNEEEWVVLDSNSTQLAINHDDVIIWGDRIETTIKCELDGMTDEITLFKVASGAEAYTVMLTNESSIVQINDDSSIPQSEIDKQSTAIVVYRGDKELTPSSITLLENGLYEAEVMGSQIQLLSLDNSIETVMIPITIEVEGKTFEKTWTIAKSQKGSSGEAGSVYILNVEDGTRSITYNQLNQNPRPIESATFSARLYKNGEDVTEQVQSWYWSTTGHMLGNSTKHIFTPSIASSFDETILNTSVSVEAVYEGNRISYTVPVAITKDASGIDWVEDWDDTRVSIRDNVMLTPKIFAGTYDETLDMVTGVAIGTDVINDNEMIGIVAYQNNITSFILGTDGSLIIGNPFEEDGVGLSYNNGEMILSVKDLSIAGESVPTWAEMEKSIEDSNIVLLNSIQANIDDMNSALDEMTSYVDTILQDEVIEEVEKTKLDALFQAVTQEVNGIQGQYNSVINNPFLIDEDEVNNLKKYYEKYMMAYDNILIIYNNVFTEDEVIEQTYELPEEEYLLTDDFSLDIIEESEDDIVEDVVEEEELYEELIIPIEEQINEVSLDELATKDGYFIVTMDGEIITMVTEDTLLDFEDAVIVLREYAMNLHQAINEALISISKNQAQDLVDKAKEDIRVEIADVDSALNNLETTMNGEFKTGLIGLQNRTILEERLKQLNIEKNDVDGQYEVLVSNSALDATNKDVLIAEKANLDTAHDILVAKINQVIADNLMTEKEIEAVNELISDYASYLQQYSKAAQECNVIIAINTANLAVQAITDEDVFNKVTNYGALQGLFLKDEKVYINSEYINTRNFKAVTDDGKETFKIDENGEVSITAKSLAITGSSNLATQDYVNTQIENITNTNVVFTLSNEFQIIPTDESYYPLSETTYVIDVKGYTGASEEIKDFLIGSVKSTTGIIAVVSNVNKTVIFSVTPDATLDGTNGYIDIPITYGNREYNKRWSWAVSKQGNQATYVTITGEQFFKYSNNYTGTPTPSQITLTANVFNSIETGKWQYDDNGVWIDWEQNGSVVTSKQITFTPTEATLPNLLRVFVRYYVDNVFDTYTVTCISDGGNGKDGIDGSSGKDGTSYYFYVRYSANANGYPMTTEPKSDTLYMGTYSGTQSVAPSTYNSYTWTLIKGTDGQNGQDGVAGKDGEDGQTSYLHIKYSDDGESFTANNGEDLGKWIGTKVDFTEEDSTIFSDYKWKRFVGEDGSDGSNGLDAQYIMVIGGQTFKYTDNFNGSPTPTSITLSATTYNVDKATYQWYYKQDNSSTWNSIQGATSSKYTLDHDNTTIFANDIKVVGLKCIVNSQLEDEITIVKITDGSNGQNGEDGKDGKSVIAITEQYYLSTSQQTLIGGSWQDTAPTWTQGYYIWTKTIFTYSDNTTLETTPICVTGKDGADGLNGGVSVSSVDVFYYQSTSSTELTGGTWSTDAPTWVSGKYVWSKTVTYLDNDTSYESDAVCITGEKGTDGKDGIDGAKGEDGTSYYFYIRYSANADGSNMTNIPQSDTEYMGVCSTTLTEAPTSSSAYDWTLIKGADGQKGQDGVSGEDGKDGTSSFLHVKYSDDGGVTFTDNNGETLGKWIGTYVDYTEADSNTTSKYTWAKFIGEDGKDGKDGTSVTIKGTYTAQEWESISQSLLTDATSGDGYIVDGDLYVFDGTQFTNCGRIKGEDGKDGTNGTSSFLHIKYSNDNGQTFTDNNGEDLGTYIGTYVDYTEADSTVLSDYKWTKFVGDNGADAYTIILTNENHSFMANSDGNITESSSTTTKIMAFKGATSITPTIGTLPSVSGLTLSKSEDTVTIKANTGTSLAMSGSFNIPITVDGKSFTKSFSWSKSLAGTNGTNGEDAYTVLLTNENHTFVANHLGVTAEQIIYTDVIAYKGVTSTTPTIGTLPTVTGLTLSKLGTKITIKANSGSTLADNGSFDIPITVDEKSFTKTFSWTKVKDGNSGKDGESAKSINILASNMVFKSTDGGIIFSPDSITLTAQYQNLTHSEWQYSIDGGTTWSSLSDNGGGITGATTTTINIPKTCSYFTDSVTSIVFKALSTDASFYDVITITKLYDVADVDFEGIAEDVAKEQIDEFDRKLNQQAVFNRLTNNGEAQGLFLDENGELYINGEYIEANTIKVEHLEVGSITMLVNGIVKEEVGSEIQEGFDNMVIGGENLIINSNFDYGFHAWNGDVDSFNISTDGLLTHNNQDTTAKLYTDAINVGSYVNRELTLSFDYMIIDKTILPTTYIACISFFDNDDEVELGQGISTHYISYNEDYVDNTKDIVIARVTIPNDALYARVYALGSPAVAVTTNVGVLAKQIGTVSGDMVTTVAGQEIYTVSSLSQNVFWDNFQLEVGNKVSSWKPSQEDSIIHTNQSTDSIMGELGNLSNIVSTNNGSDAITAQTKLTLISEFKDATSLYDNLYSMYQTMNDSSIDYMVETMVEAYVNLNNAIDALQQSITTTDPEGLSSILLLFSTFYAIADSVNKSILELLKSMNDNAYAQINQLATSVEIQIQSVNAGLNELTTRFQFTGQGLIIKSDANASKYIKLDNDSLDFMDNGNMVAQVSDQQLTISNAEIESQMKIGNIRIKPSGLGGIIFVFE